MQKLSDMTEDDLSRILKGCAEKAVCDFPTTKIQKAVESGIENSLEKFGFDVGNPLEVQEDMAHLRKSRLGSEKLKGRAGLVAVGIFVTGAIYAIWEGIKATLIK